MPDDADASETRAHYLCDRPLAAVGLALVMVGDLVWHSGRDEIPQMANNLFLLAVTAYVAYGRWRMAPLEARV